MKNIAIILAAGKGSRFSNNEYKQFLQLNKKTVLSYSLLTFQMNNHIDGIIIVTLKEHFEHVKNICCINKIDKLLDIVEGGEKRFLSVYAALKTISFDCNVLIHDSARPLLASYIIDKSVDLLKEFKAVTVLKSLKDSLAFFDGTSIRSTLNRQNYVLIETPQSFSKDLIKEAYDVFLSKKYESVTDDCGILFKSFPSIQVAVVEGNYQNMKLTYPEDFKILECLSR